jgi:RHS repeat-associated protein
MKSLALFKTRLHRHPMSNAQRYCIVVLAALFFPLTCQELHAQVGNNNPSGASGIFNGNITTGCSYDPYTGNAIRSIPDIVVAGAVGDYPLAFIRTANSRHPGDANYINFEDAGGWNHNYNWILDDSPTGLGQNFQPDSYTVYFPDGRVETFQSANWDTSSPCSTSAPCYRVMRSNTGPSPTPSPSPAGVRERFVPMDPAHGNMTPYLILPDGGQIRFLATEHQLQNGFYYYTYQATAVVDPHGLQTTFTYNGNGYLSQVTEPGTEQGRRYLQFTYDATRPWRIIQVTANDGRYVTYNYTAYNEYWNVLSSVVYHFGNTTWTASYRYCAANIYDPNYGMMPLLWTADDPMYPGPMKRIAYDYKPATPNNPDGSTPVYGQILNERYWDGVSGHETGTWSPIVSTLTVGASPNIHTVRTETRGDPHTRTFNYDTSGYLTSCTDFLNRTWWQGYDAQKYVNSVTDARGVNNGDPNHTTNYTLDAITGNVLQVQFPPTADVTPSPAPRGTVSYSYTNNYYLHTVTDEGLHTTTYLRDNNNRVTEIDYPDGGVETFPDYNSFNQVLTHGMTTGGTESFTYDTRGLKQTYRNPDNQSGNPTARYLYDPVTDRLTDVTDVLGGYSGDPAHSTSFTYDGCGRVLTTTHPTDTANGNRRYSTTNNYNDDGTLEHTTVELSPTAIATTRYTYDNYRRLKSVWTPDRGDGTDPHTTHYYYGQTPSDDVNDYTYTDSNVTWVVLPSGGKITKTTFDENRRRQVVTVGCTTSACSNSDAATTNYTYDNVGNLHIVTNPRNKLTTTEYDERNRPSAIVDANNNTTSFLYDSAGHKKKITRANNQTITYNSYDAMNRVLQQTVTRDPSPPMVSTYRYYGPGEGEPVGLLNWFRDPKLYNTSPADQYTYTYDTMGRKRSLQYPLDSSNAHRTESWRYDIAGRMDQFTNRAGNKQTLSYDTLNRMTGFSWDDGLTPSASFGYDGASRPTDINNANATIHKAYYDDNLLNTETEQILLSGGASKTVTYNYDADGNRASTGYPDNYMSPDTYTFYYSYNNRNQLGAVNGWANFTYDENGYKGDLTTRTLINASSRTTTYAYDVLDRVTNITHSLANNATRTFDYGYDSVANRKWTRRTGNVGDLFLYDLNDQVAGVWLNVSNPSATATPSPNITYDANGNRTNFHPYGTTETYTSNNLSQYASRTIGGTRSDATYDPNGNLLLSPDPTSSQLTCTYDAQNRLTRAVKGYGYTMEFKYDGLNRQVMRTLSQAGPAGGITYNVWDGWDLIEEYQPGGTTTASYLYGVGGLIASVINAQLHYYFQDGSGSTSQLADATGALQEWYRYDLHGTPFVYDANNNLLPYGSAFGVRHLFTGQQWYSDVGLYDLRNRFYSPDLGRFLQPDPSGFNGDPTNLYRHCGNNPVTRSDPAGLGPMVFHVDGPYSPSSVFGAETKAARRLRIAESREDSGPLDFAAIGMMGASPIADGMFFGFARTEYSTDGLEIPGAGLITTLNWLGTPTSPDGTPILRARPVFNSSGSFDDSSPLGIFGDVIGKILNVPNDIAGLLLGIAGLPFGDQWSFSYDGVGYNGLLITDNPLVSTAITFGNVINFGPDFPPDEAGLHEMQHTWQGQMFGPLYIPLNLIGGSLGEIFNGAWHGPANFMETGPQMQPPVPFPIPPWVH